jgi:large subunit ribosomal protein L11
MWNLSSFTKKKYIAKIRLTLYAQKAAPSPLLGQALGQYGINIMEFCKKFNSQTQNIKKNVLVPTCIYIISSNSFQIQIKTPSLTYLLKKEFPSHGQIHQFPFISQNHREISYMQQYQKKIFRLAFFKKTDIQLNHLNIKAISRSILGTIYSMGFFEKGSHSV